MAVRPYHLWNTCEHRERLIMKLFVIGATGRTGQGVVPSKLSQEVTMSPRLFVRLKLSP